MVRQRCNRCFASRKFLATFGRQHRLGDPIQYPIAVAHAAESGTNKFGKSMDDVPCPFSFSANIG